MKKSEWALLFVLISLSLVPAVGGLFRLIEMMLSNRLDFLPVNPRIELAPIPAVIHLISSAPYLILGAFQFLQSIRRNYPRWHRLSGRILVLAGIVSALSGLWMTHFYSFPNSVQGSLLYVVRLFVGFFMVAFILIALYQIRRNRVIEHQAFMIRSYALGIGAGTQVLIFIPWLATVGEPTGLIRDLLMTTAWIINIAIAEVFIIIQRKQHREFHSRK